MDMQSLTLLKDKVNDKVPIVFGQMKKQSNRLGLWYACFHGNRSDQTKSHASPFATMKNSPLSTAIF